jgi:hypothetical protein
MPAHRPLADDLAEIEAVPDYERVDEFDEDLDFVADDADDLSPDGDIEPGYRRPPGRED